MEVANTFWMWTTGDFDETLTIALDPSRTYLVQTYLVKTDGSDYAHTYIAEVCNQDGDQILCGVRDEGDSDSVEIISQAVSVTVGLRTKGGAHRAEGVVFAL
ncbi:MAG TPA: hypothetical protein VFA07_14250 [Chthonomonadaceae bacterium]|nr:hypothetical protein [Chthonomonadaceae bacterium]